MPLKLDDLRRYAVARNFPAPTTLKRVLERMGYLQADPIRSPARAQDLILRQRVKNYRAGDIEQLYTRLDIEEDFFVNYGYVTRALHRLMHPRSTSLVDNGSAWPAAKTKQAKLLLEFVRSRGSVHPREVDEHFAHGKIENYWGGSSSATTHLLQEMQYVGMVRIVRREKGIRIYSVRESLGETAANQASIDLTIDALVDVLVGIYAPLPGPCLSAYLSRLRYAVPQWKLELPKGLQRAKARLSRETVDDVDWFWPANESPKTRKTADSDTVRLLAPFDPLVHDRRRFEMLWDWEYRFEAYTPVPKRKLGYYAMPLLWRDHVIGWANLNVRDGELQTELGFVKPKPADRSFKRELDAELNRIRVFLDIQS
jgi:uncharacterized protein